MESGLIIWCWVWIGQLGLSVKTPVTEIRMLSKSLAFVLNPGQSVHLECDFFSEEFIPYENSVTWKKIQKQEVTKVNSMERVLEPLASTSRYKISTEVIRPPRFLYSMEITNAQLEDSANYTCEVLSLHSTLLASVTYYIFIRAELQSLALYADDSALGSGGIAPRFVEDVPRSVRCESRGGYPAPRMAIYLGNSDITERFHLRYVSIEDGRRSLRLMKYLVVLETTRLTLKVSDDGAILRCLATVPGLASTSTSSIVSVHYGPIIVCEDRQPVLHTSNFTLVCIVRANPEIFRLYFSRSRDKIGKQHQSVGSFHSRVMSRADGTIEAGFIIETVTEGSFTDYELVAENAVSRTVHQFQLRRSFEPLITLRPQNLEGDEKDLEGEMVKGEDEPEELGYESAQLRRKAIVKLNSRISEAGEMWRQISRTHFKVPSRLGTTLSIMLLIFFIEL